MTSKTRWECVSTIIQHISNHSSLRDWEIIAPFSMTMLKEFQMLLWTKLSQTRESKTQENHPSPSFIFLISFSFCFHCQGTERVTLWVPVNPTCSSLVLMIEKLSVGMRPMQTGDDTFFHLDLSLLQNAQALALHLPSPVCHFCTQGRWHARLHDFSSLT